MGRAVAADRNGVVRKDENDGQPHKGSKPNARPKIVRERQEGGHEDTTASIECKPVRNGSHCVFSDAEKDITPKAGAGEVSPIFEVPKARNIGRASDQIGKATR